MTAVPGLQGLIKAGVRVFSFPSYVIVQQWYAYLLNLNENTPGQFIYLSVTSCTAGLHVNRHRDYLRLSFTHHLGDFTEESAGLLLTAGNN